MRTSWLYSVIIALLAAGPLWLTGADGSLDSRTESGGSLHNRLIVEPPDLLFVRDARIILWIRHDDDRRFPDPQYRLGLGVGGSALGPLTLTGGLRELATPHPSGARGTSWLESTAARLDPGVEPAVRRGLSLSPGFFPAQGSVIQVDDGVTVAMTAGSLSNELVVPRQGRVEVTAAASRPASDAAADPADIPWFGRTATPSDMLHLLCRSRFSVVSGDLAVETGPAVGISLAETLRPGWWCRLAIRAESSLTGHPISSRFDTPSYHGLDVQAVGIVSLTSVSYRLPYAKSPAEAAAAAFSFRADRNERAGVTAEGRLALAWLPAATVPGVAFTLLGLQLDDAGVDLGAYTTAGRWRFDLAAGTAFEWADTSGEIPGTVAGDPGGRVSSARPVYAAPEISVGVRYETPEGPASDGGILDGSVPAGESRARARPVTFGTAVRILSEGTLQIGGADTSGAGTNGMTTNHLSVVGSGTLHFGPTVSGSNRLAGLTATVRLATGEQSWGVVQAGGECRVSFQSGAVKYRAGVEVEWDRESEVPVSWTASVGWTVHSVTAGE